VCVRVRVSAWQPATAARRLQSPARVAVAVHGHVRLVRAVREAHTAPGLWYPAVDAVQHTERGEGGGGRGRGEHARTYTRNRRTCRGWAIQKNKQTDRQTQRVRGWGERVTGGRNLGGGDVTAHCHPVRRIAPVVIHIVEIIHHTQEPFGSGEPPLPNSQVERRGAVMRHRVCWHLSVAHQHLANLAIIGGKGLLTQVAT
jgi:hypothetical protein